MQLVTSFLCSHAAQKYGPHHQDHVQQVVSQLLKMPASTVAVFLEDAQLFEALLNENKPP